MAGFVCFKTAEENVKLKNFPRHEMLSPLLHISHCQMC